MIMKTGRILYFLATDGHMEKVRVSAVGVCDTSLVALKDKRYVGTCITEDIASGGLRVRRDGITVGRVYATLRDVLTADWNNLKAQLVTSSGIPMGITNKQIEQARKLLQLGS